MSSKAKIAANCQKVINVNGLSKKDDLEVGASLDWKDLNKWMADQEKYFYQNKIESEESKINHIILHIDVRHWPKLEKFFRYNQREVINYELIKSVIVEKVRKAFDPSMPKYDSKVDGYVDKILIQNLNLENLKIWMRKLRACCDGQAKEDYLVRKIMARVKENKREVTFKSLIKEINDDITLYELRLNTNNSSIGKEKIKELRKLKEIKGTITNLLDSIK